MRLSLAWRAARRACVSCGAWANAKNRHRELPAQSRHQAQAGPVEARRPADGWCARSTQTNHSRDWFKDEVRELGLGPAPRHGLLPPCTCSSRAKSKRNTPPCCARLTPSPLKSCALPSPPQRQKLLRPRQQCPHRLPAAPIRLRHGRWPRLRLRDSSARRAGQRFHDR